MAVLCEGRELVSGIAPMPQEDYAGEFGGLPQPDPQWVRGKYPECGAPVVSNMYYSAERGYITIWHCWERIQKRSNCDFERVL